MNKSILILVLVSMTLATFEGAADGVAIGTPGDQEYSHEMHNLVHVDEHEHGGTDDHDNHFCHCNLHAVALLSSFVTPAMRMSSGTAFRHDDRFSSRSDPPLLRPPNS